MARLQYNHRGRAFFGAAAAAHAFAVVYPGVQPFIYANGFHGTDFLAAAAGYTFRFVYYCMTFWQGGAPFDFEYYFTVL